jgi:hypothetical protein
LRPIADPKNASIFVEYFYFDKNTSALPPFHLSVDKKKLAFFFIDVVLDSKPVDGPW